MKNFHLMRLTNRALLFFLVLGSYITCYAQLENTMWKSPPIPLENPLGPASVQSFFLFTKEKKVIWRAVAAVHSQVQVLPNSQNPLFNPFPYFYRQDGNDFTSPYDSFNPNNPYGSTFKVTPGLAFESFDTGSYVQMFGKYFISFDGKCKGCNKSTFVAEIKNGKLEGRYENGEKKETWALEKMTPMKD